MKLKSAGQAAGEGAALPPKLTATAVEAFLDCSWFARGGGGCKWVVDKVSEGVDSILSGLRLEDEVTPSDLFQIMANMLRESEAAMARGTATPSTASLADVINGGEPHHQGASATRPTLSSEIRPYASPSDQDSGARASVEESSGLFDKADARSHSGLLGKSSLVSLPDVDWKRVLAGPSGSSSLVTDKGR